MKNVSIKLKHTEYDIHIGNGILKKAAGLIHAIHPHQHCGLFSDKTVYDLHGETLKTSLQTAGYNVLSDTFAAGESSKTIETITHFYTSCIKQGLERKSPIIALGGGVSGDLVGFVAASYLRGVPFAQIPTSLLAMVDSSVGGKVGYNHALGKNLIGAFHQPSIVIIDTALLQTLPKDEFQCGMAECVKHGVLGDADLFEWTEKNVDNIMALDSNTLETLIERNVSLKAKIVMQDERESNVRALLNLGHTFGHAIEVETGYTQYKHGQGVALGCVAACYLAVQEKRCDESVLNRTKALLDKIGLPTKAPLPPIDTLMNAMKRDKKVQDGEVRLVLPDAIGKTSIVLDTPSSAIEKAWRYISA